MNVTKSTHCSQSQICLHPSFGLYVPIPNREKVDKLFRLHPKITAERCNSSRAADYQNETVCLCWRYCIIYCNWNVNFFYFPIPQKSVMGDSGVYYEWSNWVNNLTLRYTRHQTPGIYSQMPRSSLTSFMKSSFNKATKDTQPMLELRPAGFKPLASINGVAMRQQHPYFHLNQKFKKGSHDVFRAIKIA